MNTHTDSDTTHPDVLIDLGAASVETKGPAGSGEDETNQRQSGPGLFQD